jgi:hypothetical protein
MYRVHIVFADVKTTQPVTCLCLLIGCWTLRFSYGDCEEYNFVGCVGFWGSHSGGYEEFCRNLHKLLRVCNAVTIQNMILYSHSRKNFKSHTSSWSIKNFNQVAKEFKSWREFQDNSPELYVLLNNCIKLRQYLFLVSSDLSRSL